VVALIDPEDRCHQGSRCGRIQTIVNSALDALHFSF
jgi:hypothetical protein